MEGRMNKKGRKHSKKETLDQALARIKKERRASTKKIIKAVFKEGKNPTTDDDPFDSNDDI